MQFIYLKLFFIFPVVVLFRKQINTNYYYIIQEMSLCIEMVGYGSAISFSKVLQVFGKTIF